MHPKTGVIMRIYLCLSLTKYVMLLFQGKVHAVSSGKLGPALCDLNESASSDGNSHPAMHRSPRRNPSAQQSFKPTSSSSSSLQSVNNKDIALKDSATSSDGRIKVPPSMTKYSMRENRTKINYADLQGSSSSAGSYAPSKGQNKKRGSTECKIHRPDCLHWDTLDLKTRKQESKRYERSLLSKEEKQAIRKKDTLKFRGDKGRAEAKRLWERKRIANMKPTEKKDYLVRKALVMRKVRARKRKLLAAKKEIDQGKSDFESERENKRPTKKLKSLSDLSKSGDEKSLNRVTKQDSQEL